MNSDCSSPWLLQGKALSCSAAFCGVLDGIYSYTQKGGCVCLGVYVYIYTYTHTYICMCMYTYIWVGGVTSFSQPGESQLNFSPWSIYKISELPKYTNFLTWGPLKFSHCDKLTLQHYTSYNCWRKGSNFIILHTVPPDQEVLVQSFIQVFAENWVLFKSTLPPGVVTTAVSVFSSRIIFINNFYSDTWLCSVYYSVNSI